MSAVSCSEFNRTNRLTKSAKSRLDGCGASKTLQHTERLAASSTRLFSCLFSAFTAGLGMSATAGWVRIKPRERTNKADLLTFLSSVVEVFEHPATSGPVKSFSGGDHGSLLRTLDMSITRPAPARARKKPTISGQAASDPLLLLGQRFASLMEYSAQDLPIRPIDAAGLCGEIMLAMSYHQAQSQVGAVVQIRALIYFLNKISRAGTADIADFNVIVRLAYSSLSAMEGSCDLARESLAGHFMVPSASNPFMPSISSTAPGQTSGRQVAS